MRPILLVTDYKPRTTWWCNKLYRSQAVNKSVQSTKVLFSAIWIHCLFYKQMNKYTEISFFQVFPSLPSPPLPMTYFRDCLLSFWSDELSLSTFCQWSVLCILMMSSSWVFNLQVMFEKLVGVIPVFSCQKKKWKEGVYYLRLTQKRKKQN